MVILEAFSVRCLGGKLRLEALRALASSAEGYERELLLACSHADVEELKAGAEWPMHGIPQGFGGQEG